MKSPFSRALSLLLLSLMSACIRLPEYAQPRMVQIDDFQKDRPQGFTYRPLTIRDFRAASLPENLSIHSDKVNAHSAIQIRPTADSKFKITRWFSNGQENILGTISYLAFEAVMFPDKSWWNPRNQGAREDYVLQHEQIHFALTELAARKLTRDSLKWAAGVSVIKPTPQEVVSEMFLLIKDQIHSAMKANLKRHTEFDEHTSLYHNPKWQSWWFEKVEKELNQTLSPSSE